MKIDELSRVFELNKQFKATIDGVKKQDGKIVSEITGEITGEITNEIANEITDELCRLNITHIEEGSLILRSLSRIDKDIECTLWKCITDKIYDYNYTNFWEHIEDLDDAERERKHNQLCWDADNHFGHFYPYRWAEWPEWKDESDITKKFSLSDSESCKGNPSFPYLNGMIHNKLIIEFYISSSFDYRPYHGKKLRREEMIQYIKDTDLREKTGFRFSEGMQSLCYPLKFNFVQLQNDYPDFTSIVKPLEEAMDRLFENIHVFDELIEKYRQVVNVK